MGEFLFILPILNHYLQNRHKARLPATVESFRRLAEAVDYVQAFKRGRVGSTAKMDDLMQKHFDKHVEVHGREGIKPKWHSMLHLKEQVDRDDGILLDTITNERDNQAPKNFAEDMKNFPHFERHVMGRLLAFQLLKLKELKEYPHLVGQEHYKSELDAWISYGLKCRGLEIGRGDIVRTQAGTYLWILACGQTTDALFILSDEFILVEEDRTTAVLQRQLARV